MKQFILSLIFILLVQIQGYSQTFTHSGKIMTDSSIGIPGVTVKLYERTTTTSGNNSTTVKVYRTHGGTGSTTQYQQYPSTRSEMDRCFNTSYSNTTLWSTTTMSGNSSLNFGAYTTLTSAGASVPSWGDYYATEVSFTFTPLETGTYSFGLTSDDGGDLWLVNYGSLIEWYGGKGTGVYKYGSVSLTAGTSYTLIARMQEYSGGDGLYVVWKRPSQSAHSYQSAEVGTVTTTTSAWTLKTTTTTNSSGDYSFSNSTNSTKSYYIEIVKPTVSTIISTKDFVGISDIVLQKTSIKSYHYHKFDMNTDGNLTISDMQYISSIINGARSFTKTTLLFTQSEWTTLSNGTTNLKSTIPGITTNYTFTPSSGGTTNFYLLSPGYTNQSKLTY